MADDNPYRAPADLSLPQHAPSGRRWGGVLALAVLSVVLAALAVAMGVAFLWAFANTEFMGRHADPHMPELLRTVMWGTFAIGSIAAAVAVTAAYAAIERWRGNRAGD